MLLKFQEYGQERPIIILQGLFGSARNWQGIARVLGKDHHVIAPDLRNHGQSPHVKSMSYIEMANDVISIANQLNRDDVVLAGHSMGGKVAMTAALTNPDRISALVVVDIAPVNYSHDFKLRVDAMNSLPLQSLKTQADVEAELGKVIDEISVIQFIIQNLVRSGDGFRWRINLEQITANLDALGQFPDTLANISCRIPALFLGGSEPEYLRSIYNTGIFQFFPAAEIIMIEGAGHWLHAEKPNEFLHEVKTFISFV
ncbi:MAG: alpha/beta fold hydrolase [Proteobacteria bacterium]|nr:alpha/beta fold hydrolase [Pseudomonadota bacterium]